MGMIPIIFDQGGTVKKFIKKHSDIKKCFNKDCPNDRTDGKLCCSAECMKAVKQKEKEAENE